MHPSHALLWALLLVRVCPLHVHAAQGHIALVPFSVGDAAGVSTVLPRIGSGPGWFDETFSLCLDCTNMTLKDDPGLRSATATQNGSFFEDVVYWRTTFSVQHFQVGTGNQIALARGSDLFAQFAWVEFCPRHHLLALHKTGTPQDTKHHVCGTGATALHSGNCTSLVEPGCVFRDLTLNFYDVSQEKHTCTGLFARSDNADPGDADRTYTPVPDRVPVLDREVNVFEKQWYATYDGATVRLFKEHVAVHTHTWQTFLALEMHLVFYTHFIADTHKDPQCSWTRLPLLFGSIFAAATTLFVWTEIQMPERLYALDTFFRGAEAWYAALAGITAWVCAFGAYVLAVMQHANQKTTKVEKLAMTIFYEMALCIPLTLLLMGGGKRNLLNLLFLFTVTVVTLGARIRDFMRIYKGFEDINAPSTAKLGWLYFLNALVTVIYALLVLPGVWRTAMVEIFVAAPAVETATYGSFAVFVIVVAKYAYEHKAYHLVEENMGASSDTCRLFKTNAVAPAEVRPAAGQNNNLRQRRTQVHDTGLKFV